MTIPFYVAAPIFGGGMFLMKASDKTKEQLINELAETGRKMKKAIFILTAVGTKKGAPPLVLRLTLYLD